MYCEKKPVRSQFNLLEICGERTHKVWGTGNRRLYSLCQGFQVKRFIYLKKGQI